MPAADNPSREEVNAKLEAVEARLDGKLTSIEGKLDRLGDQMVAFNTIGGERFEHLSREVGSARDAAERAATSASNVKWNIFFTALGVVATLFAAWMIWSEGMEMIATILGASGGEIDQ